MSDDQLKCCKAKITNMSSMTWFSIDVDYRYTSIILYYYTTPLDILQNICKLNNYTKFKYYECIFI